MVSNIMFGIFRSCLNVDRNVGFWDPLSYMKVDLFNYIISVNARYQIVKSVERACTMNYEILDCVSMFLIRKFEIVELRNFDL